MKTKRNLKTSLIALVLVLVTINSSYAQKGVYLDPGQPVNTRVERPSFAHDTRRKNRTDEYALCLCCRTGKRYSCKNEACRKLAEGKFPEFPGPAGGFFTLANTILHEGTLQQAKYL